MFIVCRFAPPGSPLGEAIDPQSRSWTLDQAMLASLIDLLNQRLWQAGGGKGPRPKPNPRPWDNTTERFGQPMTVGEADELAARFRATN